MSLLSLLIRYLLSPVSFSVYFLLSMKETPKHENNEDNSFSQGEIDRKHLKASVDSTGHFFRGFRWLNYHQTDRTRCPTDSRAIRQQTSENIG